MAAPTLSSLSPPYAAAGGPAFSLFVNGSGFVSGSVVQWNGAALTTTYWNSAQVSAQVDASRIATPGTAIVKVINPDGTLSGGLTFTINASSAPYLTAYGGPTPTVGGPGYTLEIDGSGFVSGAVAQWSGQALSTTFASSTLLYAQVPASDVATAGDYTITVVNPGGGVSNGLPISVLPELDSVTPSSIPAGSPSFTVTVTGRGFPANSQMKWNGVPLPTTFVSSTQLTATVAASQVLAPLRVMLTFSYPGVSIGNGFVFNVTNPSITTLSPSTVAAGGPGFTLTVTGSNFVSGSQVQWNTQALATTFISSTQLTAQVSASMIANAGNAMVAVTNNVYTVSNSVNFIIGGTMISSLAPASAAAGSADFTLAVNGTGFATGAQVLWNGGPLSTNFISSTQLTALVQASRVASPGSANVQVASASGGVSNGLVFTVVASVASLTSISPASVTAGGAAFTLTVNGSGFLSGSTVQWGLVGLTTIYVNANQLTATVPANLIVYASGAPITVVNPGGAVSNSLYLSITVATASLSGISPNSATAGGAAFTLTANGAGFVAGSMVLWNGSPLVTTYVSGNQLSATVPASLIASPGAAMITVVNPGGVASNPLYLSITVATASLSGISPNSATAGGAAFTLTANGAGFVAGSMVLWNGSPLVTTYVSGNQLSATVPASLIASPGAASVSVQNLDGSSSNGFGFAINAAPSMGSSYFVPMIPCRVVDTRNASGPFGGPSVGGGTPRNFVVPNGPCSIPSGATAYSLNVAVVPQGALGYLTIWPSGQPQPLVSTLNSLDGRIKANAAIVPAGANGAVSVYATDTTDVILDINGYFTSVGHNATALAFYPLSPCRIADTRNPVGVLAGPTLTANSTRSFPILASACGMPTTAQAYSLNFAAVPQGGLGYLTAWPDGQTQPLVSTINDLTGTIVANAVIVPAGGSGAVDVFATDNTDLVIDGNGYFAPPGSGGLSLYTIAPCRVLDTRQSPGMPISSTLSVNVQGSPCAVPAVAQAYVFNATVVPQGSLGFITLWPQGQQQPLAATLNSVDGAITSNMAVVPSGGGYITIFSSNPTHVILDISGYFAP